jgi:hypothetical protein
MPQPEGSQGPEDVHGMDPVWLMPIMAHMMRRGVMVLPPMEYQRLSDEVKNLRDGRMKFEEDCRKQSDDAFSKKVKELEYDVNNYRDLGRIGLALATSLGNQLKEILECAGKGRGYTPRFDVTTNGLTATLTGYRCPTGYAEVNKILLTVKTVWSVKGGQELACDVQFPTAGEGGNSAFTLPVVDLKLDVGQIPEEFFDTFFIPYKFKPKPKNKK